MNSNRNHRAARKVTVVGTVSLVVMLAGCATSAPKPTQDPAAEVITGASQKIHQAMLDFSRGEAPGQARAPGNAPADAALVQPITFNWDGPAGTALKSIAGLIGWRFQASGSPGPLPLNVSVHARHKEAFRVMRNIGDQVGSRASVTVDVHTKTVELDYAGDGAKPGGMH